MKTITFANNDQMPALGLGTWQSEPDKVYQAVRDALSLGYRHIDCAAIYGNEAEVGQALAEAFRETTVRREDVWITSKLWNNAHAPEDVQPALERSLQDLQLDYIDLYLIHWPIHIRRGLLFPESGSDLLPFEEIPLPDTWSAMETLAKRGMCRHIGASNFSVRKLQLLLETAELPPEMNQIELHPYLQQEKMLNFCRQNNINVTAYSPLGSAARPARLKSEGEAVLLEDPAIQRIAEQYSATVAQILISWAMHRNTAVIPKSVHHHRLEENFNSVAVALTEDNMATITTLDRHYRYVNGEFWTGDGSPYSVADIWDE